MKWWWQPRLNLLSFLLLPLSLLYWLVTTLRRFAFRSGILRSYRAPIPVIVVGNITIGGTGKTPFTIALVGYLIKQGYKPAIVSRGYSGKAPQYPMNVSIDSNVAHTGDEALLLKQACDCPVMIDPKRPRAIKQVLKDHQVDVIISDDGLQHYAMQRDIEIIMVDGERQFGNRMCIPSGPLRETVSRIKQADFVITTGNDKGKISPWNMQLTADKLINCKNPTRHCELTDFNTQTVHAIAGIGNPQRFFNTLTQLGVEIKPQAFPDHYLYDECDLATFATFPLVMTSKDAVKCHRFAKDDWWYLNVQPHCSDGLLESITQQLTLRRNDCGKR